MLQETDKVDLISTTEDQKNVRLTITDALKWDDEYEHLKLLQKKIYAYFDFIEDGQLYEEYPQAKDKNIIITILAKYSIPENGHKFYQQMKSMANESGYEFEYKVIKR